MAAFMFRFHAMSFNSSSSECWDIVAVKNSFKEHLKTLIVIYADFLYHSSGAFDKWTLSNYGEFHDQNSMLVFFYIQLSKVPL
jgi:hypothetical protein